MSDIKAINETKINKTRDKTKTKKLYNKLNNQLFIQFIKLWKC